MCRNKVFTIGLILGLTWFSANGQFQIIDSNAIVTWPSLDAHDIALSNDGQYFYYSIDNLPLKGQTLYVQSVSGDWKIEMPDASAHEFSQDGTFWVQRKDSLFSISLGKGTKSLYSLNIKTFRVVAAGAVNWLIYQLSDDSGKLVLVNLGTGISRRFINIDDFELNGKGEVLLLKTRVDSSKNGETMDWIDLARDSVHLISMPVPNGAGFNSIGGINFDEAGKQIVFSVVNWFGGEKRISIWRFAGRMERPVLLASEVGAGGDKGLAGIDSGYTISGVPEFTKTGRWVVFYLSKKPDPVMVSPGIVPVDIWSYKDMVLEPEQKRLLASPEETFAAVVDTGGKARRLLDGENKRLITVPSQITGDFAVVMDEANNHDFWWTLGPQPSFYLVSLLDGSRRTIKERDATLYYFSFSPGGRWLVYYDSDKAGYFSFNVKSGIITNITEHIPSGFSGELSVSTRQEAASDVAGWCTDESCLLLNDNYDVWMVDPSGRLRAVNITNGFGVASHIKFRLIADDYSQGAVIQYDRNRLPRLLVAFNVGNKYNGFYRLEFNEQFRGNPGLLYMGPYTFYRAASQKPHYYSFDDGMIPIRAKNSNCWLVKRQSASDAPNLFYTTDFRIYRQLTDINPQRNYNWISSELVSWKMFDGHVGQGVLYKPKNFNKALKYPVIFNFYEQLSHRLYEFPGPNFTTDDINIPWFVSRGYLVFTPDIHFEVGAKSNRTVGEWAYNSIVSAAKALAQRPYIDGRRMAIQGHSFGGLETAWIVTHSGVFAAACEVAGSTDPISRYLTLIPSLGNTESVSPQWSIEMEHEQYGASPWQRPDLYLRNSAVLNADRATTPLLIMHNKKDNQVQWRQGVELFMALRRLKKRVWMLQYDNGGHSVFGQEAIDFTERLTQFFDYYLKGGLPPRWMTVGVPARLTLFDNGYEPDGSGQSP